VTTLNFDPETHVYTVDGRRLPSVTQVLADIFGAKDYWTEWHRERGTAVHKAVEIIAKGGTIDPATLDERIAGRVAGFELFLREHPLLKIIESEQRFWHLKRFYAGTIDLGLVSDGGEYNAEIIADIKGTIEPVTTYAQLGAYSIGHEYQTHKMVKEAWGIELTDGKYKLKIGKRGGRHADFDLNEAEQAWLSIFATYNWKKRHSA
jgi:hypothetical protein